MRKIISILLLFFYVLIEMNTVAVMADSENDSKETFELYGESALLMDAKTGEIIYEKNGYTKKAIASTTKVLTCLIAIENGNLQDVVTFSDYAASQPDVQMNADAGEEYLLIDLLKGMMLESYNDVAVAIAEHIAGDVNSFAEMMNQRAQKIGCENYYFITPNGLDAENGESWNGASAADIALIMSEAISNQQFLEITQIKQHTIHELHDQRTIMAYNRNSFLDSYNGTISGKTGFTGKAGYCYVGAVTRENRTFVAVTLASGWPPHKTYKWKDMQRLFDYGFENYFYKELDFDEDIINEAKILVENGKLEKYNEDVYARIDIPADNTERLLKKTDTYYGKLNVPSSLTAPLQEGEVVGTLDLYVNDEVVESREIKIIDDVEKNNFWWNLYQMLRYFFDKFCRITIEIG